MSSTERAGVGLTETMARLRGLVSVAPRAGTLYVPVRCTDMTALLDALDADLAELTALRASASEARQALLNYARAHGNVNRLSHDMCEVEMFKAFIHAMKVLGIDARQLSDLAAATREQHRRGGEAGRGEQA